VLAARQRHILPERREGSANNAFPRGTEVTSASTQRPGFASRRALAPVVKVFAAVVRVYAPVVRVYAPVVRVYAPVVRAFAAIVRAYAPVVI
jgi:hypothetical protein